MCIPISYFHRQIDFIRITQPRISYVWLFHFSEITLHSIEKIQSGTSKDSYFVYYLDAKSKSVIKQKYEKGSEIGFFSPVGPKRQSYCANVKADWDTSKIEEAEISKEQEQILKTQKQILKDFFHLFFDFHRNPQ